MTWRWLPSRCSNSDPTAPSNTPFVTSRARNERPGSATSSAAATWTSIRVADSMTNSWPITPKAGGGTTITFPTSWDMTVIRAGNRSGAVSGISSTRCPCPVGFGIGRNPDLQELVENKSRRLDFGQLALDETALQRGWNVMRNINANYPYTANELAALERLEKLYPGQFTVN